MLGKLLIIFSRHRARRKTAKRMLSLEELEVRWAPAVISTWNWKMGNATTNWSDGKNWTNNAVPKAAGDQATFDVTSVSNCTVDIPVTLDKLTITNAYTGTITLNNTVDLASFVSTSSMDGGTVKGKDSPFRIDIGTFNWTGGTFDGLSVSVLQSANMNISGSHSKSIINAGVLSVQGTNQANGLVQWNGGSNLYLDNASEINITSTGQFYAFAAGTVDTHDTADSSLFVNYGLFRTQVGAGNTFTLKVGLISNSNNLTVSSGTLRTERGSQLTGNPINVSQGAMLWLDSQDPHYDELKAANVASSGAPGSCTFSGHVTVSQDSTLRANVSDLSTSLDGSGNLMISNVGTGVNYSWYGLGPWTGSGKMIIGAFASLTLDLLQGPVQFTLGRTIDNWNSVVWVHGASAPGDINVINGANIINENGATFDIQVDANILNGGGGSFQNLTGGVIQKSAGTGTTRIDLPFPPSNGGTIKTLTSGRIQYTPLFINLGNLIVAGGNGGMDFAGGFQQNAGGSTSFTVGQASITVSGGNLVLTGGTVSTVTSGSDTISVTGQVQQSGGTVTVGAGCSISATNQYVESGGSMELRGGTVGDTNGVTVSGGGLLHGYGFINVASSNLTNSGTIHVGDFGPYNIAVTGNYVQTGSGYLNVDVSTSANLLAISGTAALGGTLNVNVPSPPPPGTTLEIITYASRGSSAFANVIVPSGWTWWYDDTQPPDGVDVHLTYQPPPH